MSNSVLYCIKIGGLNVSSLNIENVVKGITSNVFHQNYEIHLSIEDNLNSDASEYINNLKISKNPNLKFFFYKNLSWYNWLKCSFISSKNFEYLITSHDDTYFRTKGFDKMFINEISKIKNIGCFTFIDDGYKRRFFNPQLRGAYHIDRVYQNSRKNGVEYEYHFQKKNWHKKSVKIKKLLNYLNLSKRTFNDLEKDNDILFNFLTSLFFDFNKIDFPKKAVRAHSLWTNIMGFKVSNLKHFDITDLDVSHGVFADEDICLATQKNELINVLIPDIQYYHDREIDISRSWKDIKNDHNKVSKLFYNKWKFYPIKLENIKLDERLEIIKFLELEYDKKLTWTKDQYSYDWQYIN